MEDMKVQWSKPMKLYYDNKSAIGVAYNPVQFIKGKLDSGLICTPYVPTGYQLVDVLTKGLCSNVFHKNISKLGMEDLYSPA